MSRQGVPSFVHELRYYNIDVIGQEMQLNRPGPKAFSLDSGGLEDVIDQGAQLNRAGLKSIVFTPGRGYEHTMQPTRPGLN